MEGALEDRFGCEWSPRNAQPKASDKQHPFFKASNEQYHYFIAQGSFNSPREIPSHYHFAKADLPEAGASGLERIYERIDYGFVVEHRWSERITNIVTLPGFLKARDELLDAFLPPYIEVIEKVFGREYDVSRLADHLRKSGRRFVENVSIILYDAATRGRPFVKHDGQLDPPLTESLCKEAEQFGLDPKSLIEIFSNNIDEKERESRCRAYLARLARSYVRHHDGSALTIAEADALVRAIFENHHYAKAFEEETKQLEKRLEVDKQLEKRTRQAFQRMVGLYADLYLFSGPPEYEFAITLPGELIETNGTGTKAGRTLWKFDGLGLFPDG